MQAYLLRSIKPEGLSLGRSKRIIAELKAFKEICNKGGKKPAILLLGDIPYESGPPNIFSHNEIVEFFGFTEDFDRMLRYVNGLFPHNYSLTFRSNSKWKCTEILKRGGNVGLFFDNIPSEHWGYPVYKAEHPFRFLDLPGVIALEKSRST